ncbi:MAG: NUDIX hydrolase [Spirochaetaceae bacterium]
MIKKWKTLNKKLRGDYRIFKTFAVDRQSSNGEKKAEFYLVESPDWMTIVPVLKNEEGIECFLMVKQYRHGSDSITLEFPAGMVDPGEDSYNTAARELSEETGYKAESITLVSEINPNPAFMTNKTSTFVARGLTKSGEQNLDEHEEIETLLVPTRDFESMVGGDMVNSAIMVQAYYFYQKSLKS